MKSGLTQDCENPIVIVKALPDNAVGKAVGVADFVFFFAAGVIGSSCAMTGLGVSATVGYVPGSTEPVGGTGFTGIVCG